MAELIIQRKNDFVNGMQSIDILLNDKKLGNIGNGETKKWKLEAGAYILRARAGLALKSQNIHLNMNDKNIRTFRLESFGNAYAKTFLQLKEIDRPNGQ